ncbi:MAG: hypothetical protein O6952_06505 [Planctomycetota bacterium]|nr:hypothetical protein [Planctomycetota bacterium]
MSRTPYKLILIGAIALGLLVQAPRPCCCAAAPEDENMELEAEAAPRSCCTAEPTEATATSRIDTERQAGGCCPPEGKGCEDPLIRACHGRDSLGLGARGASSHRELPLCFVVARAVEHLSVDAEVGLPFQRVGGSPAFGVSLIILKSSFLL